MRVTRMDVAFNLSSTSLLKKFA